MPKYPIDRQQRGRALWILLFLVLLLAIAGGYYFYLHSSGSSYVYRPNQVTELHGVVNWEHSNIPATRTEVVLYQRDPDREVQLSRKPVTQGYYRFKDFPVDKPVFIRVYRQTAQGESLILETASLRLEEGRARYLPLYLPSSRERRQGGFPEQIEGRITRHHGTTYLSLSEDSNIQLKGDMSELAGLQDYLVVIKGHYLDRQHFQVGDFFVLEGDTGDRPMLGRLQQQTVEGKRRFVLAGEEDRQLLLVPGNYRLRPQMEHNLGELVLLTGPLEQGAIKPLTLTVVKPQ
jgi:hypothetical protein